MPHENYIAIQINFIDVIIVNWNSGSQLRECIDSLLQFHSGVVSKVIIVDNNSSDNSLEQLKAIKCHNFSLHIIKNAKNIGFAAACNQGAALSASEHLLFLNPDTQIFENSLSIPLAYMGSQNNSATGIIGIQLLDESGIVARSCARFPALSHYFASALGFDKKFPRYGLFMNEWEHDETRCVDHVIGAFFFVRRCVFDALKGFDENFFVYLEDLDFSLRAKDSGWCAVYLSEAQAYHAGGGCSRQIKAIRLFYSLRSRLIYGIKHFGILKLSLLFLLTLTLEFCTRTMFSFLTAGISGLLNTWRAYGMLLKSIPEILRKR